MSSRKKKGKKKKHFSSQERKARVARARKEFAKKLELVAEACGALDTFKALPERLKKHMLNYRINHIILASEDKLHPGKAKLKIASEILSDELFERKIYLNKDAPPISLYDYSTAAWTLYVTLKRNAHKIPGDSESILNQFSSIPDLAKKDGGVNEIYGQILFSLALTISTFDKGLYYGHLTSDNSIGEGIKYYLVILLKYQPPQVSYVYIDHKRRPVYRVGWGKPEKGVSWLSIRPTDIGWEKAINDINLPVYVQSHALQRLAERLDSICMPSVLHHGLFESMKKLQIKTNKNGHILIEYKLLNLKLGYLVIDVIDGKVVVKTFLFITNDKTPEGEKLKYLLGLSKYDKKYWAIDRLSTFLSDELRSNFELCEIFKQAGCDDLFKDEIIQLGSPSHRPSIRDLVQFIDKQYKSVILENSKNLFY